VGLSGDIGPEVVGVGRKVQNPPVAF